MNCEMAMEEMSMALDDMLTEEQWQALLEHLSRCPSCAALWRQWKENQALLKQTPLLEVPAGFHEEWKEKWQAMLAEEEKAKQEKTGKQEEAPKQEAAVVPFPKKKQPQPWKKMGVAAAAVFLMAVVGMGGRSLMEYQKHQEEMTGSQMLTGTTEESSAEPAQTALPLPETTQTEQQAVLETEKAEEEQAALPQQAETAPAQTAEPEAKAAPAPSETETAEEKEAEPAALQAAEDTLEATAQPSLAEAPAVAQVRSIGEQQNTNQADVSAQQAMEAAEMEETASETQAEASQPMLSAVTAVSGEGTEEKKLLSRKKVTLAAENVAETLQQLSALTAQATLWEEENKVVLSVSLNQQQSLLEEVRALGTVLEEEPIQEDITFWYTQTKTTEQTAQQEAAALEEKAAQSGLTAQETAALQQAKETQASCQKSLQQWDAALKKIELEVYVVAK